MSSSSPTPWTLKNRRFQRKLQNSLNAFTTQHNHLSHAQVELRLAQDCLLRGTALLRVLAYSTTVEDYLDQQSR